MHFSYLLHTAHSRITGTHFNMRYINLRHTYVISLSQ